MRTHARKAVQPSAPSAHTPGPWTAHDDDGTGTLPCVLSDKVNAGGNFYVAQCNVFEDARRIAAVPEMLAVLKQAQEVITRSGLGNRLDGLHDSADDLLRIIRFAIRKAEGEA